MIKRLAALANPFVLSAIGLLVLSRGLDGVMRQIEHVTESLREVERAASSSPALQLVQDQAVPDAGDCGCADPPASAP